MRVPLLLLLLSLAIRAAVALPVILADAPLLYDEVGYDHQAAAWVGWVTGEPSASKGAYGHGRWPPLWPMLLALARALPGSELAAERLLGVLLGALTTPLAWWTARRMVPERAAVAAGLVHALYPPAVVFSHLVLSETLFCLLAVALTGLAARAADDGSERDAVASGALLGLAALTRAAAMPWLVVLPLWLGWRVRPRAGALALAAALIVVAPWQGWLLAREGRPVVMTTTSGPNLYLGNNPWTPAGLGSSGGDPESLAKVEAALAAEGGSRDRAARRLAIAEVRARPVAAVGRAAERLVVLGGLETHPVRHLLSAAWPPVAPAVAGLLLGIFALGWPVVAALVARGLASRPRHADLLLLLALSGLLPPLLTIAAARLRLPLVLLLLPAAGLGATARPLRPGALALGAGLALLCTAATLRPLLEHQLEPSRRYAPVVAPIARLVGATPRYADRVQVVGAAPVPPEGCEAREDAGSWLITCASPAALDPLELSDGRRVQLVWRRWQDGARWLGGRGARPDGS